jgi:hypothetical protein
MASMKTLMSHVGVERLRIAKVVNPRVLYYGLNEDLDVALSGLVGLVVLV